MDWTKEKIDWYVDNELIRTLNYEDANGGDNFPQTPMNISKFPLGLDGCTLADSLDQGLVFGLVETRIRTATGQCSGPEAKSTTTTARSQ